MDPTGERSMTVLELGGLVFSIEKTVPPPCMASSSNVQGQFFRVWLETQVYVLRMMSAVLCAVWSHGNSTEQAGYVR